MTHLHVGVCEVSGRTDVNKFMFLILRERGEGGRGKGGERERERERERGEERAGGRGEEGKR